MFPLYKRRRAQTARGVNRETAGLRSTTVIRWAGLARFIRMAKNSPAGPAPMLTIFIAMRALHEARRKVAPGTGIMFSLKAFSSPSEALVRHRAPRS